MSASASVSSTASGSPARTGTAASGRSKKRWVGASRLSGVQSTNPASSSRATSAATEDLDFNPEQRPDRRIRRQRAMRGIVVLQVRRGRNDRSTWWYDSERTFAGQAPAMTTPLFAPALAFVDLETTGTTAQHDAITEVGIVRVDADPGGLDRRGSTEWSSLVDPGVPIPPAIQALTGITDAMVRGAPRFANSIADEVAAPTLDGATFVAHNARFDYGFLKHAFARARRASSARVLCTVRLSRRLFPDADRHSLDCVIERHGLPVADRHRALGDARVLWEFVQALYRELPADDVAAAVKRVMKMPSLPPQLAPDALDAIPEAPGVYLLLRPQRCRCTSARRRTCANASAPIFRRTTARRPTSASRSSSAASSSTKPPANSAR